MNCPYPSGCGLDCPEDRCIQLAIDVEYTRSAGLLNFAEKVKKPRAVQKSDGPQVLTYLVRIETYGKREKVKQNIGERIKLLLDLNFNHGEVWFVSKADVPKRKPYDPMETPSNPMSGD